MNDFDIKDLNPGDVLTIKTNSCFWETLEVKELSLSKTFIKVISHNFDKAFDSIARHGLRANLEPTLEEKWILAEDLEKKIKNYGVWEHKKMYETQD